MAVSVALFALALVTPTPARAHHTTVTGTVVCQSNGSYVVQWAAVNSEDDQEIVSLTATLSDEDTGTVAMSPIPVPASGTATGTSTHPGTTTGTLVLTVDAEWDNGRTASNFGEVQLFGDCVSQPETKLTLVKSVSDGSAWTLTMVQSGGVNDSDTGGNGTKVGPHSVTPGVAVAVSETGPAGYTTTFSCDAEVSASGLGMIRLVTLTEGQQVTCTFTNTPPFIPPPPGDVTITITKLVTTDGIATGPAAGTQFEFDLDCIGFDQTFSLADGESHQATFAANTQCSLAETNTQDADSVDGEFSNVLISSNRSFTVTNHYQGAVVLATAISKTLITADPVAVGEQVDFEISVSFVGTTLPDADFVDIYENAFLEFISLSEGGVALACTVFPNTPDAAHDTVVCPAGELTAATTVTISFTALQSTLPGSMINRRTSSTATRPRPSARPSTTWRSSRCWCCHRSATAPRRRAATGWRCWRCWRR